MKNYFFDQMRVGKLIFSGVKSEEACTVGFE